MKNLIRKMVDAEEKMIDAEKVLERKLLQTADWADRWKDGKTGWHHEEPNSLYDKGHTVWGIDVAEQAMTEFFASNSMNFTKDRVGDFDVFQNEDKRINLIRGDYFALSSQIIGQFDAVWDRGSFVAINPGDRERYVATVLPLLKRSVVYLMATLHYDISKWPGPPHDVTETDVARFFGPYFNINYLGTMSVLEDTHRNDMGLDFLDESAYLLTMKTN